MCVCVKRRPPMLTSSFLLRLACTSCLASAADEVALGLLLAKEGLILVTRLSPPRSIFGTCLCVCR